MHNYLPTPRGSLPVSLGAGSLRWFRIPRGGGGGKNGKKMVGKKGKWQKNGKWKNTIQSLCKKLDTSGQLQNDCVAHPQATLCAPRTTGPGACGGRGGPPPACGTGVPRSSWGARPAALSPIARVDGGPITAVGGHVHSLQRSGGTDGAIEARHCSVRIHQN